MSYINLLLIALLFIIGSSIGSFINVVIYRYQPRQTVRQFWLALFMPGSHCRYCQHRLKVRQIIPILSWLSLGGRCYYCQQPLACRYLFNELLTALIFVTVYILSPAEIPLSMIFILLFSCLSLLLSEIDCRYLLLPNGMLMLLLLFGALHCYLTAWLNLVAILSSVLIGTLLLWLPRQLFYLIHGYHGLGAGDIKLIAALSVWLSYDSLPLLLVLSCAAALSYILLRRQWRSKVAFGPFILLAANLLVYYRYSQLG